MDLISCLAPDQSPALVEKAQLIGVARGAGSLLRTCRCHGAMPAEPEVIPDCPACHCVDRRVGSPHPAPPVWNAASQEISSASAVRSCNAASAADETKPPSCLYEPAGMLEAADLKR
jgi:hypothetical protein